MRLAFAGTPDFAVAALDALHAAGHEIAGVFTQPDRPAGRGQKLTPSPVAVRATALGLPVFKPLKMNAQGQQMLRELQVELFVVVAYGLILPQAALDIPPRGCFNIHASLLPRWRGAAPIQRSILAGDAETGVTIMRMEAGLDTGPMLVKDAVTITETTTAAALHDALAAMGGRLIVEAVAGIAAGTLREAVQPAQGVTYAAKLSKEEARVDWSRPAMDVVRAIHGYNPMPGAWSELNGERLKFFRAQAADGSGEPGTVLAAGSAGLTIACGERAVLVTEMQKPGGRAMSAGLICANWNPVGLRLA